MNSQPESPLGHGAGAPSPWVQRWSHLVAAGGTVLDVACGMGRHLHWFEQQKHPVVGVDTSSEAINTIALANPASRLVCADLEGAPWPFANQQFAAVVVTHYLWRALFPALLASLAPGGVLLYETFAAGNATVGKPSRPDFLLQSGELLRLCDGLHVVAYEDGFLDSPARFIQRIAAVRPQNALLPERYAL